MATPCHTRDSICYFVTDTSDDSQPACVFTGDTLFIGGTGRFFEGNGEEMQAALDYLGTLPDSTITYVGHEYTKDNLAFAKSVDPNNNALQRLDQLVNEKKVTTGSSTIGDEKEWNVFMRTGTDAIRFVSTPFTHPRSVEYEFRKATRTSSDAPVGTVMDALRDMKNNFKAG
jgi:hydroxyacylglutathione hydrolase